jgi:predicted transcriptional regulator of viral defense system
MSAATLSQREQLRALVSGKSIVRAQELRNEGIAGSTIQRALDDGDIIRVGRGLYQDPQSDVDSEQMLAEVAKRIPKGVIAMVSALAHPKADQVFKPQRHAHGHIMQYWPQRVAP